MKRLFWVGFIGLLLILGFSAALLLTNTRFLGQRCGHTYGGPMTATSCLPPFICVYPRGIADVLGRCSLPGTKPKWVLGNLSDSETIPTAPPVNTKQGSKTTLATFPPVLSFRAFSLEYPNSWTLETKENLGFMTRYQLVKEDAVIVFYQAAMGGAACVYSDTDVSKLPEEFRSIKPITQYKEIQFKSGILRRHRREEETERLQRNAMLNSESDPVVRYNLCNLVYPQGSRTGEYGAITDVGGITYILQKNDESLLLEMDTIISSIRYLDE